MRMKLLVTGLDFLIPWCGDYIKSAEAVCTSDCSEENLSRMVADCDAILYMQAKSYPITRKIIDSAKKLRFIQSAGVGYEKIDLVAAMENGVVVMNMPTGTTVSIAATRSIFSYPTPADWMNLSFFAESMILRVIG